MSAADHQGDFDCASYDTGQHRVGTKGADGRCSWTGNCPAAPTWSTQVATDTRPGAATPSATSTTFGT